ncbi:MAG TPA: response regulator, partial [Allosphingosinicella sp.]|nr:response regulator [Allosphingosinicella sp.]
MPIKIMIVGEPGPARAGLFSTLSVHGDLQVIAACDSAAEALRLLAGHKLDVIILDLGSPGRSGLDCVPGMLTASAGAKVLVACSSEDGPDGRARALALGASDTLIKPGSSRFAGQFSEMLANRVRSLGRARKAEEARQISTSASSSRSCFLRQVRLRPMPGCPLGCLA